MRQNLPENLIVMGPVKKFPLFYHICKNHPVDPILNHLNTVHTFRSSLKDQLNLPLPIDDFQMFLACHTTAFSEGEQKLVFLALEHLM